MTGAGQILHYAGDTLQTVTRRPGRRPSGGAAARGGRLAVGAGRHPAHDRRRRCSLRRPAAGAPSCLRHTLAVHGVINGYRAAPASRATAQSPYFPPAIRSPRQITKLVAAPSGGLAPPSRHLRRRAGDAPFFAFIEAAPPPGWSAATLCGPGSPVTAFRPYFRPATSSPPQLAKIWCWPRWGAAPAHTHLRRRAATHPFYGFVEQAAPTGDQRLPVRRPAHLRSEQRPYSARRVRHAPRPARWWC